MTEYRIVVLPRRTPVGPWRRRRADMVADALAHGLAERDADDAKRIWWHPLAGIETREP